MIVASCESFSQITLSSKVVYFLVSTISGHDQWKCTIQTLITDVILESKIVPLFPLLWKLHGGCMLNVDDPLCCDRGVQ